MTSNATGSRGPVVVPTTTTAGTTGSKSVLQRAKAAAKGIDVVLLGEIGLISATEAVALASVRKYVETKKKRYLLGGMLGYSAVVLQLPGPLSRDGLGGTNVIWNGLSSLMGVAVGTALFHEKLQPLDYVAIPIATVGTMMLALNHA